MKTNIEGYLPYLMIFNLRFYIEMGYYKGCEPGIGLFNYTYLKEDRFGNKMPSFYIELFRIHRFNITIGFVSSEWNE